MLHAMGFARSRRNDARRSVLSFSGNHSSSLVHCPRRSWRNVVDRIVQASPLLLFIALVAAAAPSHADTLLLKNGGKVTGTVVRRPNGTRNETAGSYVVQLNDGIHVRVAESEVGRISRPSDDEDQYAQLLPSMPDTAEGHQTMAKWCQDRGLRPQMMFHWKQVLQHDDQHAEARRMLGFVKRRGQWSRPSDTMESQGYVRYKGAWRLPAQVATQERSEQIELIQKTWRRDIRKWRKWLGGRKHTEAVERLQAIDDPLAAAGLHELLADEKDASVRMLYVDLLGKFATGTAIQALIDTGLTDDDVEVRVRCLDYLKETGRERANGAFIAALRSKNNRVINRAGVGLGHLGDAESIMPLINALVTQHETIVKPTGNIRPTFGSSSDGGGGLGGLSAGGGPKRIVRHLENRAVLEALVALTDQNFRYSESDWKNWYVREHSLPAGINLRRDDF